MSHWTSALSSCLASGGRAVLVSVVATRGSVPRGPGTRMVVATDAVHGTIGGGHLEFQAIDIARELIGSEGATALRRFPLGASLGQCCGGLVQLLFEPARERAPWQQALEMASRARVDCVLVTPVQGDDTASRLVVSVTSHEGTLGIAARDDVAIAFARGLLSGGCEPTLARIGGDGGIECFFDVIRKPALDIVLFGAGHVGRALVNTLSGIDCRITWVDTRDDAFPSSTPSNVECVATDAPESAVDDAPAGAYFLVMTHSHGQDEQLTQRILARNDFAYFGLIGSLSKRRQFEKRLEARGMPRERFAAMTCPIGVDGIGGKEPEVIAIAVAAQLLQVSGARAVAAMGGQAWRARSADRLERRITNGSRGNR